MRALCLLFWTSSLHAGSDDVEAAWRGLVAELDIAQSTLAMMLNDELVLELGHGRPATDAMPVASLSKSITAACITALVEEGHFNFDDTVGELLSSRPDVLAADAATRTITLSQLITHQSGLLNDSTQSLSHPALNEPGDWHDHVSRAALANERDGETYFYNNENYAILGSMIMEHTGESVEDACTPRVLSDMPSAMPAEKFGGMLAWGGWAISAADMAAFVSRIDVPPDAPRADLDGGVSYGPGIVMRDVRDGQNIWHFGAYCLASDEDAGAFFVRLTTGITLVMTYDFCPDQSQAFAIQRDLVNATF